LYAKSAVSAESTAETALLKALRESLLANLGAGKAAVVFDSYLAAAQKIGDGCYGFLGVFCARTDRKDKVAQRKSLPRREDLISLFHRGCTVLGSKMDAKLF
jgi:hypothetical protein